MSLIWLVPLAQNLQGEERESAREPLFPVAGCGRLMSLSIADFSKVEMKVGRIGLVEDIPAARKPMYKLTVEFGDGVSKQCVAGIKDRYSKEDLTGKVVVAVVNLEPKSVAGVMSECMLLAAFNENELSLLTPDRSISLGTKVG